MKTIKLLSIGLFVTGALLFSSCKKEGCTNPAAENYDVKAKASDKSCTFNVNVVFWMKENTSLTLQAWDVQKLNFLLNGEPIGKSGTTKFWEEAPECATGGTIKFTKELTKSNSAPFYYSVLDEEGEELWQGITQLDTDSCKVILLEGL